MSKTRDAKAALDFLKARFLDDETRPQWRALNKLMDFAVEAEAAALEIHQVYVALRSAYELKIEEARQVSAQHEKLYRAKVKSYIIINELVNAMQMANELKPIKIEEWRLLEGRARDDARYHVLVYDIEREDERICQTCGIMFSSADIKAKKLHEDKKHVYLEDPLTEGEPS